MSQGFPQAQPPKPSGGMSTLTIVLIVVGVLFLGCAGLCGGCIYVGRQAAIQGGQAFTETLELAGGSIAAHSYIVNNEEVKLKYGDVPNIGAATREGDTTKPLDVTNAHFSMPIEGNGAKGKVHVKGKSVTGQWTFTEIKVNGDDGSVIDVDVSAAPPPPELQFSDPTEEMPADPTTPPPPGPNP